MSGTTCTTCGKELPMDQPVVRLMFNNEVRLMCGPCWGECTCDVAGEEDWCPIHQEGEQP